MMAVMTMMVGWPGGLFYRASACLFSETCCSHNATLLVKQWKLEFTSISHGSTPSF
jgi:hypothetical protein